MLSGGQANAASKWRQKNSDYEIHKLTCMQLHMQLELNLTLGWLFSHLLSRAENPVATDGQSSN